MPGYRPPSARMRQIKQQRTQQVEAEARQAEQEAVEAAKEPKVEVKVGAMTATVTAGPDGKLGTADDEVKIKPSKPAPAKPKPAPPKPKPAPVKAKPAPAKKPAPKPKARPVPKFDKDMTKEQLLKVAKRMKAKGLTMRNTKVDILKALKKAAKSWK